MFGPSRGETSFGKLGQGPGAFLSRDFRLKLSGALFFLIKAPGGSLLRSKGRGV